MRTYRTFFLLALDLLAARSALASACVPGGEAPATQRSQQSVVDHYRFDPILKNSWVIVVNCRHPEWPAALVYAEAQGPLVLGGYSVTANGSSRSLNHPTTGRIPSGAIVERSVPLDLEHMRHLSLLLNDPDFRTAEMMSAAVNKQLKRDISHAVDSRRIDVEAGEREDIPELLAEIEAVEVDVYPRAKVVVNERTGTVVIGGDVRLQPVSILHGGLSVNVISEFQVSQPGPLSQGTTQVVQQTTIQSQDKPVNRIELRAGATVDDLVQNLQQIGASARDVISILQAMKEAGALEAELEVM